MKLFGGMGKAEEAAAEAAAREAAAREIETHAAQQAAEQARLAAEQQAAEQARAAQEAAAAELARKAEAERAALVARIAPVDGKPWMALSQQEQAAAVKARLEAIHTNAAGDSYIRSAQRVGTPGQRMQLAMQASGLHGKLSAPVKDILAAAWAAGEEQGLTPNELSTFSAFVRDPRGIAVLQGLGVKDDAIAYMQSWETWAGATKDATDLSETFRDLVAGAEQHAEQSGRRTIGMNDLLAAYLTCVNSANSGVGNYLAKYGVTEAKLSGRPATPMLDSLTRDFTAEARKGSLDPMVGRKRELQQVMGILRSGGNPVLLGEAGVGKSALAEGLAQQIADGTAPSELLDKRVLSLDLDALNAGTQNRGMLEEKTQKLFDELRYDPDVVLFIDELHRITGNASGDQNDNLAERLKPPMARGEFSVLGATTLDEFNRDVAKDPALARRFTQVSLDEPTISDTRHIMLKQMERISRQQGVSFAPDVADTAIEYANRYLPDLHRPAGPLSLVRTAAGNAALRAEAGPPALDAARSRLEAIDEERANLLRQLGDPVKAPFVQAKIDRLDTERADVAHTVSEYQTQMAAETQLQQELDGAVRGYNDLLGQAETLNSEGKLAEAMAILDDPRFPELEATIRDREKQLAAFEQTPLGRLTGSEVTTHDLAAVVKAQTGIRVGESTAEEKARLLSTETELGKRVKGQDHVLSAVGTTVRRAEAHVGDPNRPRGSFIFLGPTGTGKTETAKALAEFLFGDPNAMVRVDMSEYQTKESVAGLIGSPPGYLGHEEGGRLTGPVRKRPYSVVLLDEIEKAHPEVFDTLLQVLDDGHLTDSSGKKVDFKNTYIVMTSNATLDQLKAKYRPEFLNRLDHILTFNPLDQQALGQIVDKFLASPKDQLAEQYLHLDVTPEARAELAKIGFDPVYGARPLRRAIEQHVENPASDLILAGKVKAGDTIRVGVKDGNLTLEPVGGPPGQAS